jgi:paraquat-inducible protein B
VTRRANPMIVGSFILGAIALVVVAVVVFGSSSWFRHRPRAVAFFQGNIQGLNVGAPVTLRGVPVGSVTEIRIVVDFGKMISLIPVYMEFEPESLKFKDITELTPAEIAQQSVLKRAIAHGLHARLATQSFVTGQLAVELSFDPNEPIKTVGADPKTVEIPTALSDIEKLKDLLARLPLNDIATQTLQTIESINRLVSGPELADLLKSFTSAAAGVDQLVAEANTDIDPLVTNVNDALRSARDALVAAQTTIDDARAPLKTANAVMAKDLRQTLRAATSALESANVALSTANTLMANSQQRYDLDQTLRNLSATSESLRSFADELERRPNSLLMGK